MRQTSTRTRILLGISTVLGVVVLLLSIVLEGLLGHFVEQEVTASLTRAEVALRHFAATRDRFLSDQARALAQVPHLRAILDTPDVDDESLAFTLATIRETTDVPLIVLCNRDGDFLMGTAQRWSPEVNLRDFAAFEAVLSGQERVGMWRYAGNVYAVAASPATIGGELLGAVVLGVPYDSDAAMELRAVTGRDVTLVADGVTIAFAGEHRAARPSGARKVNDTRLIEDEELLALALPLDPNGHVDAQVIVSTSVAAVAAPFHTAKRVVFSIGLGILVLAFLVSHPLSKRLARPIVELSRAVDSFSAGNLNTEVVVEGPSEVVQLGASFNVMAERLRALLVETLEKAEAAESASHAKSAFLSTVSHEVRTPLNGILGLTEALAEQDLTDEQQAMIADLRASNAQLMQLLDKVLAFTQSEEGELEDVEFDLRRSLRQVVDPYAKELSSKGVEFALTVADDVPARLRGPGHRLQQILRVYVENAVQFTNVGSVAVEASLAGAPPRGSVVLRVEVRDTGPGIAPEDQQRVFEPFTQLDHSFDRDHGGAGLGLAVCRDVLERAQGRYGVDSRLGAGSTFWFELPLRIEATPEPPAALPTKPRATVQDADWRREQSILVVEDNAVNQRVATLALKKAGWEFEVAENGAVALELLDQLPFDLILMDLQMPVMDGFEATRRIRAGACVNGADVPIVALTANTSPHDREVCVEVGMNGVIGKPVKPVDLVAALDEYLAPTGAV